MDVIAQNLETREAASAAEAHQVRRDGDLREWLNAGAAPEVRLVKFDRWVRAQLSARLDWSWAGVQRERRIEQSRIHLENLVLGLWRRGWMLDGAKLAKRIEALLDAVGRYQRTGKVLDFWPYFKASVDRYVGANAEELSAEAMSAGAHMNQSLARLISGASRGPSLPELVAQRAKEVAGVKEESLRQKISKRQAKDVAEKAAAEEPQLL